MRNRDELWEDFAKMREQLDDLADHVANAKRPSKSRTAEALRAIRRGDEWRLGRWP